MQERREPERVSGKKSGGISELVRALVGDRSRANERLIAIIAGVAFGLAAYFFGRCELLFATYPLGIALICAANRHLPYILIGLCLSAGATTVSPAVAIGAYLALVVIRIFTRLAVDVGLKKAPGEAASSPTELAERIRQRYSELFSESVYLRMASSCIGAFCLSLYSIIVGGFRYYDLFGVFFGMVAAPVATFIFASYFDKSLRGTRLHDISCLCLLSAVCYSLRDITFFGVYIGAFVAFFATLCVGRRRGILSGCLTGLCLGLAFRPIYAPLFILEAAAAGVLWNISALAAATAGCVVGMIWGVYVNGLSSLSELLPALLCGTMVFGAADKLSLISSYPELISLRSQDKTALQLLVRDEINRSDESCIRRLSSMFGELAESFYNLSDRLRRPGSLDLRRMCDGVFDKYCKDCPRREVCWGVEYSATLETLNRLTSDLHTKARADISSVPEYLKARCAALPGIITDINESCARLTEHALMCDRTGVFALDYDGVSQILSEALESGRENYIIDDGSAERVSELLKRLRFGFGGVIAYGGRRKSIAVKGLDPSRARIAVGELRGRIEEVLGLPLGDPTFTPVGSKLDMTVSSRRRFCAEQHSYSINADGQNGSNVVCGDTVSGFCTDGDYFYTLLSDGMGSGKEAAFTSRVCSMFLEKMLSANNRSETSIKLLNSFMSERDGSARHESSATVDLFEFDLLDGRAALIKSGAAPTFVLRGQNCFKLSAKTVPLGIIDKPDTERLPFEVEPGDRVIMVSDGVTQSRDDCAWLVGLLSASGEEDAARLARRIVERARAEGSEDDITATVIEIGETDTVAPRAS